MAALRRRVGGRVTPSLSLPPTRLEDSPTSPSGREENAAAPHPSQFTERLGACHPSQSIRPVASARLLTPALALRLPQSTHSSERYPFRLRLQLSLSFAGSRASSRADHTRNTEVRSPCGKEPSRGVIANHHPRSDSARRAERDGRRRARRRAPRACRAVGSRSLDIAPGFGCAGYSVRADSDCCTGRPHTDADGDVGARIARSCRSPIRSLRCPRPCRRDRPPPLPSPPVPRSPRFRPRP